MTTPDDADQHLRDGEIPHPAPPGGLIGALLLIYGLPAAAIVVAVLLSR